MRFGIRAALAAAAMTGGMAAAPVPAGALTPAAGALTVEATLGLSAFPCPTRCGGTVSGIAGVALAGAQDSQPWTLAITDGALTGSISTTDANLLCQGGIATGHLHLVPGAVAGTSFGTYGAAPLPHPVVDAVLDADFTWERISTTVRMNISNVFVTLTVDPAGLPAPFSVTVVRYGAGGAVGTFVPGGTGWALPCVNGVAGPATTATVTGAGHLEGT